MSGSHCTYDALICAPPAPSRPPTPLDELLRPATQAQGGGQ